MSLYDKYKSDVVTKLKDELGVTNPMALPKIEKVTINVGLGKNFKDSSKLEAVEDSLTRISGQKPVKTKAKKSISNFKIREGNVIGMKVTLRGKKMYDFVEKLIRVTLPRVRDFRGLSPKTIDRAGNFSVGIRENIAFPEIKADAVDRMHGLEVTITTSARTRKEGKALFTALGFPFAKK